MNATSLSIKLDPADAGSLELFDGLDNVLYTQEILEEYFAGLYDELASRAGGEGGGIKKTVFIDVRKANNRVVYQPAGDFS
jgi:hypothetical protein